MGEASIAVAVICRFADELVRKKLVRKLKAGDVVDQWFRSLIQNNLKKIIESLEGEKRKDLKSSISNFKQGISLIKFSKVPLSEVDGEVRTKEREDDITKLVTAVMGKTAKERFKRAREQAHDAFNNSALSLGDRIQATEFCVKAQILESADNLDEALTLCKHYLEAMHSLEEVQRNFALEVDKRNRKHKIKKAERRKIISSVCGVNRILFDITEFVADNDRQLFIWPCIKIQSGNEEIDPLRDTRLREALLEQYDSNKEDCLVVRSFGNKILNLPHSIATNSKGQFIVVDSMKTKVFSSSGEYLYPLQLPIDYEIQQLHDIVDVDTDQDGNVYLLVEMRANEGHEEQWFEVVVFHEQDMHLRFKLKEGSTGRKLTVNSRPRDKTEVLILEGERGVHARVEVYDAIHGEYLCYFDGRKLNDAQDIAAASDGHVFVLDSCLGDKDVHEFSADRKHLCSFGVDPNAVAITFDRASDHIVIVSAKRDDQDFVYYENVSIYDNKDADKNTKRKMTLEVLGGSPKQNIVVTAKGRIAVVMQDDKKQGKIVVV